MMFKKTMLTTVGAVVLCGQLNAMREKVEVIKLINPDDPRINELVRMGVDRDRLSNAIIQLALANEIYEILTEEIKSMVRLVNNLEIKDLALVNNELFHMFRIMINPEIRDARTNLEKKKFYQVEKYLNNIASMLPKMRAAASRAIGDLTVQPTLERIEKSVQEIKAQFLQMQKPRAFQDIVIITPGPNEDEAEEEEWGQE